MTFKEFLNKYYNDYNIKIIELEEIPHSKYYNCKYTVEYNNIRYSNVYSDYIGYEHMNFLYINHLISKEET